MRFRKSAAIAAATVLAFAGTLPARAETVTYTYDARGRLASAAYSTGATITYSYDAAGNRTQVVVTGGSNTAPDAVNDSLAVTKNTAASFDPRSNDSDANNDTLTITSKTNGAHGTVSITGGGAGLTFTPTTGYTGSDSFTYTISDGTTTDTATVSVTVSAPTITVLNPYYEILTSGSATVYVASLATASDSATLTITAASDATIQYSGARFYYTAPHFEDCRYVYYTVQHPSGSTESGVATFAVYVSGSPPPACGLN